MEKIMGFVLRMQYCLFVYVINESVRAIFIFYSTLSQVSRVSLAVYSDCFAGLQKYKFSYNNSPDCFRK